MSVTPKQCIADGAWISGKNAAAPSMGAWQPLQPSWKRITASTAYAFTAGPLGTNMSNAVSSTTRTIGTNKYFKCTEIDPTCLSGDAVNAERSAGLRRLFRYKFRHYPLQTFRLLWRFLRHMPMRDVVYLIVKPFLGAKRGETKAESLSRAVEHGASKDAAADLTKVSDNILEKTYDSQLEHRAE